MTPGLSHILRPNPSQTRHPPALLRAPLTEVELICIEPRLELGIRFGRHSGERIVSQSTRVLSFRPDAVFALLRRTTDDFGKVHRRLDVVRAVRKEEAYTTLPFVRPGGDIYLSLTGGPRIRTALAAIDAIEVGGVDPCDVSPDHWRHMQSRLSAGESIRPYGRERHALYLRRKAHGL